MTGLNINSIKAKHKEAFEMLKRAKEEEGFDFTLFGSDTSMTSTAKVIVQKVQEYKKKKGGAK